ncbi:MAG TPA: hypothetical protein VN625_07780 [Desulfuromonadaceae bacterium]|nr:hypothetical protein [Desulfuromonadaceae bacterium]
MNSRWNFIIAGIGQAALVFVLFAVGGIAVFFAGGWIGGNTFPLFKLLIGILSGPAPGVLFHFDVSNDTIGLAWISLMPVFWTCLGIISGLIAWKARSTDPQLSRKSMRTAIVLMAVPVGIVSAALLPPFMDGYDSVPNRIINNTLQIDAAKNQFLFEKHPPTNYVVTEGDLIPYVKRAKDGKLPRVGSERYVLNPWDQPVYAVFDKDCWIPRKGTRQGFVITNGTEFHLP